MRLSKKNLSRFKKTRVINFEGQLQGYDPLVFLKSMCPFLLDPSFTRQLENTKLPIELCSVPASQNIRRVKGAWQSASQIYPENRFVYTRNGDIPGHCTIEQNDKQIVCLSFICRLRSRLIVYRCQS